jgi:uncharacterized protein (UPF0218 family)
LSKSSSIAIPVLQLPVEYRRELSIPQGTLHISKNRGVIQGLRGDATVGDVVSERHFSSLKIVDFKTKRLRLVGSVEQCNQVVLNPPGSISINSITILQAHTQGVICVIGEEDLLVIPLLKKVGNVIIYGQPDTGVVEVVALEEVALKVFKILIPAIVNIV